MTETETEIENETIVSTIKVVVTGAFNKDVEYTEGMTVEQVLEAAGTEVDSLKYGTIAIDGEVVIDKKDLSRKVTKEQQIVSVAPAASNGK